MKKNLSVILGILACILTILISGASCSSCERGVKSLGSEISGGLNRIVNVYDYAGHKIATHKGKIDIQINNNKVLFDLNGKRYIYYNALVEVIEK